MKEFYKSLYALLLSPEAKQKYIDAGCSPCRAVMNYKGQYFDAEKYEVFITPSVLVQYSIAEIEEGKKEATITLHLCYEKILDDSSYSPNLDKALEYHIFNDVTFALVNRLETECTGRLRFNSEDQQKNDAIVSVHLMTFTCSFNGRSDGKNIEYIESENNDLDASGNLVETDNYNFDVAN